MGRAHRSYNDTVVEVDAIVLFDAFERCGDELSEFAVAIILQIDGAAAPRMIMPILMPEQQKL